MEIIPNSHKDYCSYPRDPCCCAVLVKELRRTTHKDYCNYPRDPCDCGLINEYK